jgi:hypothetical protein
VFAGNSKQLLGVVETIHVVSSFCQEMRVPSLSAGDVQYWRSNGKPEQIHETRCFVAIALGREERAILEEIVGVECRLPPLGRLGQKKTGSRYAPNTVSMAARIS